MVTRAEVAGAELVDQPRAQAVVWNLDKILNTKAEQFDPKQSSQGKTRIPTVASYKALDDMTVEVVTSEVNALLPYQMAWIVMSSPAQWQAVADYLDALAQQMDRFPAASTLAADADPSEEQEGLAA